MTVDRGIKIGFAVVAAVLIALVVTLVLALGGGDDGAGGGGEPAPTATGAPGYPGGEPTPAPTEAPGGLPAELLECLEEQGVDPAQFGTIGTGGPPGPGVHEALPACAQFLPEGRGPPPGVVPRASQTSHRRRKEQPSPRRRGALIVSLAQGRLPVPWPPLGRRSTSSAPAIIITVVTTKRM